MKERPILFSGEMVKAILEGRKTQTRRVVKPHRELRCPYGKPVDQLWVRETWKYDGWTQDGQPFVRYRADNTVRLCQNIPPELSDKLADQWAELSKPENFDIDNSASDRKWRPSIFMPKDASRLQLEITDIRVERIQDISEEDAEKEGCNPDMETNSYKDSFMILWDKINKDRGFGWNKNPWVWVILFKRIS
jgi:hypothetical protein